jgi:hypothetical protein
VIGVSGAVVKRIYKIGNGTGIVSATRSLAIAADLPPSLPISLPMRAPCHSLRCVAGPSLGNVIPQHLLPYFFQLRIACNKAWEWMGPPFDLAFDRNKRQFRTDGIDSSISFPGWQRAGTKAVMTKETAGMLSLETSAP